MNKDATGRALDIISNHLDELANIIEDKNSEIEDLTFQISALEKENEKLYQLIEDIKDELRSVRIRSLENRA